MMAIIGKKHAFFIARLRREIDMTDSQKNLLKDVFLVVAGAIAATGIPYLFGYSSMNTKIDELTRRMGSLETTIEEEKSDLNDKIDGISDEIVDLKVSVATLNATVFDYRPTDIFASTITGTYAGIDTPINSDIVQLSSTTLIAYSNFNPSKTYSVEQLANQALLLPYTEDGKEVYFYGQLDDLGRWDGHCVVNIYEDDVLWLITDAQYDSGELIRCKQAFPDSSTGGQDVWVISEREMEDGYSSGEIWRYFRTGDYTKGFGLDNVQVSDIMSADMFRDKVCVVQEGYYYGNISNGKYNDDTGTAYLCKYFGDGTVRTLYVGAFKDGQFNDQTGEAWMVGKMSEGASYSYYKGPFQNGNAVKDPKYWNEPLTIEQVEAIVDETQFNCNLKWEHLSV